MLNHCKPLRTIGTKTAQVARSLRSRSVGIASECQIKTHKRGVSPHRTRKPNVGTWHAIWTSAFQPALRNSTPSSGSLAKNSRHCSTLDPAVPVTLPGGVR